MEGKRFKPQGWRPGLHRGQSCAGAGVAAVCTVGVGRSLAEGSESGGGGTMPSTDVTEAGNDRGPHWQDAGGPPSPARLSPGGPDAAQPLQGGPSEPLARSPWAQSLPGSRMPWQRLSSEARAPGQAHGWCCRLGPSPPLGPHGLLGDDAPGRPPDRP